jgi:hypothetical protein
MIVLLLVVVLLVMQKVAASEASISTMGSRRGQLNAGRGRQGKTFSFRAMV